LARDWSIVTKRSTDKIIEMKYGSSEEIDKPIVDRVTELATKHGVPMPYISTAWLLQKETVAAPIIGATKPSHIEQAVAALSIKLTPEEINYLEELYTPHKITGPLTPEPNWIHGVQVGRSN